MSETRNNSPKQPEKLISERDLIVASKLVSTIFTPFYLPLVGLIALFIFSYLKLLPWNYKLLVLLLVALFTVVLPSLLIWLYRRYQGWDLLDLGVKERRMVPYVISIICYFTCYYVMNALHIPHFMRSLLMAALLMQIVCAIINVWWKVSTHTAAIGTFTGGLIAFSFIFRFNPLAWLSFLLIVAGMVGTSRMILRQHTLSQVITGFLIGFLSGFLIIAFF